MNRDGASNVLDLGHRLMARVQLRRLQAPQSPEEKGRLDALVQQLQEEAAKDNHAVLFPTHVFLKGDEVVGYGSLAAMPVLNFWAHSGKLGPGESVRMIEQGEAVASHQGLRSVVTLCAEDSPFALHMERLGYQKLGKTVLYVKTL